MKIRTIHNKIGSRLTLQLGTIGYSIYIGSFLYVAYTFFAVFTIRVYFLLFRSLNMHPGAKAFVIAAGAILGICAGLLWTAQGALMLAYPTGAFGACVPCRDNQF